MSIGLVDKHPLFCGLTPAQYQVLQEMMVEERFSTGEVIYEQGNPAINMYIVTQGMVRVRYKPHDGPWLDVATIQKDGVFGWSATLGHPFYTSSAIALTDGSILAINGSQLRSECLQHPEIGVIILDRLAGAIADRLRTAQEQITRMVSYEMEYNESAGGRRKTHG